MGNGPTEEDAEIIQHDQLSTHSEEGEEVSTDRPHSQGDAEPAISRGFLMYLLISELFK